jgi:hypothetical protein
MRTTVTLMFCALIAAAHPARADADVAAVIDKAIAAHGGADALRKHKGSAIRSTARGTIEDRETIPFTEDVYLQPPNKSKKVTAMQVKGRTMTFVMVSDGAKNWLGMDGRVREANANEQAESREARNHGDVLDLLKLRERLADLTPLPAVVVNGRPAVGLKVKTEGHREMELFFDTESGYLVKTRTWKKYPATGTTFVEEKEMSDYQDTAGYKRPKRVVAYRDGKRFLTKEVVEFRIVDRIDDAAFAKPAGTDAGPR